jgi:hypothetical protein
VHGGHVSFSPEHIDCCDNTVNACFPKRLKFLMLLQPNNSIFVPAVERSISIYPRRDIRFGSRHRGWVGF